MKKFSVPVLCRATHNNESFYKIYVELDIEAESFEEAEGIALAFVPPPKSHPHLLTILEVEKCPW